MRRRIIIAVSLVITCVLCTAVLAAQPTLQWNKLSARQQVIVEMNRLFNENKTDSAMGYFADSLRTAGNLGGKSFLRAMNDDIVASFPNVKTEIKDIWEDGDWVIARCVFSGTHTGISKLPHHGGLLVGKAPTHKSFSVVHIRMYKVQDGKVTARQAVRDDLAMYQQLGLLPSPPTVQAVSGLPSSKH